MEESNRGFQGTSNNKGITLVALVITIIIIIILAVVAISFAFGDNGLIKRAEDAGKYYANDTAYTEGSITNVESYINDILAGTGENSGGGSTTDDGVPIPAGFYHVGGTKEEGVVISDNPADAGKGTSHSTAENELVGNQFVWIPVENESLFERYTGYDDGKLDTEFTADSCSEPCEKGYANEAKEYEAMRTSVLANKGFYVGRYETGVDVDKVDMDAIEVIGIVEATKNATVIKQGETVFKGIGWNENGEMNDEAGGAVELAKGFGEANGYESITSTLIYGVQWDAIMNFIDPKYATENCDKDSFVVDSSEKGWYDQGEPTVTGSNGNYSVKNIYDLGGNVDEWTMEAREYRVARGRCLRRFRLE